MEHLRYRVVIEEGESGWFIAQCPSLPGCFSQGKTRAEARVNIREAIECHIEGLKKRNLPIPSPTNEEIVEVEV